MELTDKDFEPVPASDMRKSSSGQNPDSQSRAKAIASGLTVAGLAAGVKGVMVGPAGAGAEGPGPAPWPAAPGAAAAGAEGAAAAGTEAAEEPSSAAAGAEGEGASEAEASGVAAAAAAADGTAASPQATSPKAAAVSAATPQVGPEALAVAAPDDKLNQFVNFLHGENPGACMFHAQMRLSLEGCKKLAIFIQSSSRVRALSLSHNHIGERERAGTLEGTCM